MATPPGGAPGSPYYAATAPAPIASIPTPYGPPGSFYRGPPVPDLLGKIRGALTVYLVVLLLEFLAAIISSAVLGYTTAGLFSGVGSTSSVGGVASGLAGLSILTGLLGFIAFILIIVSWLRWRDGVKPLPDAAASAGAPYADDARKALTNYSRTFWVFIITLLSAIGFAIALVAIVIGSVAACLGQNTTSNSTCTNTTNVLGSIEGAVLGYSILAFLLGVLLYYFATTSLVVSIRALASPADQERLDRGRMVAILGAALAPLGLINDALAFVGHAVPAVALLGVISPFLLLLGFYLLYSAFSECLASGALNARFPATPSPFAHWPYDPQQPYAPPPAMPYPNVPLPNAPPPYAPPPPPPPQ
jgi:hypothetical protein